MSALVAAPLASAAELFAIRPALADELPFVVDSWTRSFAAHAEAALPFVAALQPDAYRRAQRVVAERLTRRSVVFAAHVEGVPATLVGYAVAELSGAVLVLHWLYVKQGYRRVGVAHSLLSAALRIPHAVVAHTHESVGGKVLARALGSRFAPRLAQ